MLFKVGDVLGYFGGYNAVITQIDDFNFIYLECSDGSTIVVKRSEIIKGITSGRIKFKSFADNIKPQHWINTKFNFND